MMGFGFFNVIFIMFVLVFILVMGVFIVNAVQGIKQWNQNQNSPRLTVPATIVAKRTHVSRHGGANGHHHTSTYVTFQVDSGDRMELRIPSQEFGLLVEGDQGSLCFQGTRYLGFERT